MNFKKLFRKRHPYAPVAFLGRKLVERSLDADIVKVKKLERVQAEQNRQHAG